VTAWANGRREQHAPGPADEEMHRLAQLADDILRGDLPRGGIPEEREPENEAESKEESEDEEMLNAQTTRNQATEFNDATNATASDYEADTDIDTNSSPLPTPTPGPDSRRPFHPHHRRLAAQSSNVSSPTSLGKRSAEEAFDENEDEGSSSDGSKRAKRSLGKTRRG
jgi:hypothetical protein